MAEEMKPARAVRTFFSEPGVREDIIYPKVTVQEIKEFKVGDPAGYDEVAALCIAHYAAG